MILSQLDLRSIYQASQVCRSWSCTLMSPAILERQWCSWQAFTGEPNPSALDLKDGWKAHIDRVISRERQWMKGTPWKTQILYPTKDLNESGGVRPMRGTGSQIIRIIPLGRRVFTCTHQGEVAVWRVEVREASLYITLEYTWNSPTTIRDMDVCPRTHQIILSLDNRSIYILDLRGGAVQVRKVLDDIWNVVRNVRILHPLFLTAGMDREIRVWHLNTLLIQPDDPWMAFPNDDFIELADVLLVPDQVEPPYSGDPGELPSSYPNPIHLVALNRRCRLYSYQLSPSIPAPQVPEPTFTRIPHILQGGPARLAQGPVMSWHGPHPTIHLQADRAFIILYLNPSATWIIYSTENTPFSGYHTGVALASREVGIMAGRTEWGTTLAVRQRFDPRALTPNDRPMRTNLLNTTVPINLPLSTFGSRARVSMVAMDASHLYTALSEGTILVSVF